jgi:hypothetical protein
MNGSIRIGLKILSSEDHSWIPVKMTKSVFNYSYSYT